MTASCFLLPFPTQPKRQVARAKGQMCRTPRLNGRTWCEGPIWGRKWKTTVVIWTMAVVVTTTGKAVNERNISIVWFTLHLKDRWCYPGNALLRTCRKKAPLIQDVAD